MCLMSQEFFSLAPSASRAAATYTYEIPTLWKHKGLTILLSATVSGASGTLDAKLQYKNPVSAAWTDMPGASFVQFGAGTTGERFIQMYPGMTGSDADASLALATNFKLLNMYPMRFMRLSATVAIGAITFSASGFKLP